MFLDAVFEGTVTGLGSGLKFLKVAGWEYWENVVNEHALGQGQGTHLFISYIAELRI